MKWKPHTDIVWIDETGEVCLYNPHVGQFQSLNETGSQIWRLVADGNTESQIIMQLGQMYGVQTEEEQAILQQDVQSYIQELVQTDLLMIDEQVTVEHAS